jgi:hypothetical protein
LKACRLYLSRFWLSDAPVERFKEFATAFEDVVVLFPSKKQMDGRGLGHFEPQIKPYGFGFKG